MKIVLDGGQRRYFFEKGFVELEELVSREKASLILQEIDLVLKKRTCNRTFPEKLYLAGRDLWRDSPVIKAFDCQSRFADMARGALDIERAQLAYDQYLEPAQYPYFAKTFPEGTTLEQISNVQGVVLGLCVCLSGERPRDELPFPHAPGNVSLIKPETNLSLEQLDGKLYQRFLLVALASHEAIYLPKDGDPCAHSLKKHGYVIGDSLLSHGHPQVIK